MGRKWLFCIFFFLSSDFISSLVRSFIFSCWHPSLSGFLKKRSRKKLAFSKSNCSSFSRAYAWNHLKVLFNLQPSTAQRIYALAHTHTHTKRSITKDDIIWKLKRLLFMSFRTHWLLIFWFDVYEYPLAPPWRAYMMMMTRTESQIHIFE